MLTIPGNILASFETALRKRTVAPVQRADYKKRLRYFLDFCTKYPVTAAWSDIVRLFIDKLREKKQTPAQQEQAAYAVSLYFEMQRRPDSKNTSVHVNTEMTVKATPPFTPFINHGGYSNPLLNAENGLLSPMSPEASMLRFHQIVELAPCQRTCFPRMSLNHQLIPYPHLFFRFYPY